MLERAKVHGYDVHEHDEYRAYLLNEQLDALREAADSSKGSKVCLICFEKDPTNCHRAVVAEELSKLLQAPVEHIRQY